jgi:hypothetical protein
MTHIPTTIPTEPIRWYFIESCKIFTAFATITNDYTDSLWPSLFYRELQKNYCPATITDVVSDGIIDGGCTFPCVRLSECQVSRPIYQRNHRRKLEIQCARALTPIYRQTCRLTSKILEGFLKF